MIGFCPYSLSPVQEMGSVASSSLRKGSLLRFEFSDGSVGYSDCFPWPELGDLELERQLGLLSRGELTELTQRSLAFARVDALARKEKRSLWTGLDIPASHSLMIHQSQLKKEVLERLASQGFREIKLKLGKKLEEETQKILGLIPSLQETGIRIRLDFNSSLKSEDFESFLKELGSAFQYLDWIEDPIPYDPGEWEKFQARWKVKLALDHLPQTVKEGKLKVTRDSVSALVLKPAVQDPERIIALAQEIRASVMVTSYLDHPLGQLCAAWLAGELKKRDQIPIERGGLLSHTAYQSHFFSEKLTCQGPQLVPPQGTGWGWDSEFKDLAWKVLSEDTHVV